MKNQQHAISKRRPRTVFVEPETSTPCTWKVQKTILANLRKSAYSRVDPARAWRSRELLEQVEARQVAADRRHRMESPAAATPAPASSLPAEQAWPQVEQRHRWPARVSVKRCFTTVTKWIKKAWAGGRTRR